jgi:polyisoprenoid-binding protein YceI
MSHMNNVSVRLALALALFGGVAARGAEEVFKFGDNPKHTNIVIESATDLENIVTTTNVVKGEIKFDAAAKSGSAKVSVPVVSLSTGIKTRDEHLQGDKWLNAAKNPEISFETTSVKLKDGETYDVTGNFAMNGVTKPVTTAAKVKFVAYKPEFEKAHLPKGNMLRIESSFDLKLSDFDVKSPAIPASVSDTLKVKLAITAFSGLK